MSSSRLRLAELLLEPNDDPFESAMRTGPSVVPASGTGLQYDWDRDGDARAGYVRPESLGFMDGPSVHPYSSTPITRIGANGLPNVDKIGK